jgi:hypothetical protein
MDQIMSLSWELVPIIGDVSGIISLKGRENLLNQMDMSMMGIGMRIYLTDRALKSLSTAICSKVSSTKGRKKDINVNTHGKTQNSLAFMKVAIKTIISVGRVGL